MTLGDRLQGAVLRRPQLPSQERLVAGAAVAALILAQWAGGAAAAEAKLSLALAAAALVCCAAASTRLRAAVTGAHPWAPGAAFALVLATISCSLIPQPPWGPHPVWMQAPGVGTTSIDPSATAVELAFLLGLGCFFVVGATLGGAPRYGARVVRWLAFGGAVLALWAIVAFATGIDHPSQAGRLEGPLLAPNTAATYFGSMLILLVTLQLRASVRAEGWRDLLIRSAPTAVAAAIVAIALMLTGSRAGILLTLFSLTMVIGAARLSRARVARRGQRRGAWFAGAIVLAAIVLCGGLVVSRFAGAAADADIRQVILSTHWRAFLEFPWGGWGLGAFDTINRTHLTAELYPLIWDVRAAHNVYVQWLEEGGVVAAAAMFGCIGLIIVQTVWGRSARSGHRRLILGLLAVDFLVLAHGATDFALQTPSVAAVWAFVLGIQYGLARVSSSSAPEGVSTLDRGVQVALAACGALAIVASAACLGALSGGAWLPAGTPQLAASYDRRAARNLANAHQPERIAEAEVASRASLQLRPYNIHALLRLAQIDALRNNRLTERGIWALARSYELIPVDTYVPEARILFALDHWGDLPLSVRAKVRREQEVVAATRGRRRVLREALARVSDSRGRVVASLWLLEMNRTSPSATSDETNASQARYR